MSEQKDHSENTITHHLECALSLAYAEDKALLIYLIDMALMESKGLDVQLKTTVHKGEDKTRTPHLTIIK